MVCHEKFWYVRKIFGPLKWYTDRNYFGDGGGGGEVVKNNILRKNFLSANLTLTPPLFSPPRYGPEPESRNVKHALRQNGHNRYGTEMTTHVFAF